MVELQAIVYTQIAILEGLTMTLQTLTLGRQKFVLILEKDFRRLQEQAEVISAQDKGDIAEAKRRKTRGPIKPYTELRKKLGLA